MPRSRVAIFRNDRTRSTPLDPKLTFWCVSYYLGAFGTVSLPYETRCKTGRTSKSSCHEVVLEFLATNAPDPPFWTITSCFGAFRTIWVHFGQIVALQHSVQNEQNFCKSKCHEVASQFFAMNAPDPRNWTLDSCFGVLRIIWVHLVTFGCFTKLGAKQAEVVQKFVP